MHGLFFGSLLLYLPPLLTPPLSVSQLCLLCFAVRFSAQEDALVAQGQIATLINKEQVCFLLFDTSSAPPQTNIQCIYSQTITKMCIRHIHTQEVGVQGEQFQHFAWQTALSSVLSDTYLIDLSCIKLLMYSS